MKVILQKDVEDLGKEGEIKEVKDGFARNYLIPEGMAKGATEEKIKKVKRRKEKQEQAKEEELKELQETVSELQGQEVEVRVRVGKESQLYESITAGKIQTALSKVDFKVKKDQIKLKEPIKELGEFTVPLEFKHNLETEIRVIVKKKE